MKNANQTHHQCCYKRLQSPLQPLLWLLSFIINTSISLSIACCLHIMGSAVNQKFDSRIWWCSVWKNPKHTLIYCNNSRSFCLDWIKMSLKTQRCQMLSIIWGQLLCSKFHVLLKSNNLYRAVIVFLFGLIIIVVMCVKFYVNFNSQKRFTCKDKSSIFQLSKLFNNDWECSTHSFEEEKTIYHGHQIWQQLKFIWTKKLVDVDVSTIALSSKINWIFHNLWDYNYMFCFIFDETFWYQHSLSQ